MGDDAKGLVKTGKVVELRDPLRSAVHAATRYLKAWDDAAAGAAAAGNRRRPIDLSPPV
jgi:hypothetical protein